MADVFVQDTPLTPKQEAFCYAIVNGKTQSDAYKEAYNAEKMLPNTIYTKASSLMTDGKISRRVAELRGTVEKKVLWSLEDSVMALKGIYQNAERDADKVAAIKELNSVFGYKASVKFDVTSGGKEIGLNTITIVAAEKQVNEAIDMIESDENLLIENDADYIDVE